MEPVTVALLTAVLSGLAGTNETAHILVHAREPTVVWVAGEPIALSEGEVRSVAVMIPLAQGRSDHLISVVGSGVTHELRVRAVGKRAVQLHWWIPAVALCLFLFAVSLQRKEQPALQESQSTNSIAS
jgi:hypothetical protein